MITVELTETEIKYLVDMLRQRRDNEYCGLTVLEHSITQKLNDAWLWPDNERQHTTL